MPPPYRRTQFLWFHEWWARTWRLQPCSIACPGIPGASGALTASRRRTLWPQGNSAITRCTNSPSGKAWVGAHVFQVSGREARHLGEGSGYRGRCTSDWRKEHREQILKMVRPDRLRRAKTIVAATDDGILNVIAGLRKKDRRSYDRRKPNRPDTTCASSPTVWSLYQASLAGGAAALGSLIPTDRANPANALRAPSTVNYPSRAAWHTRTAVL